MEIILSIKPKYVKKIISGEKTIELRRRALRIPKGTNIWIYSTLPEGKIVACVTVEELELIHPQEAWENHSEKICVTDDDFINYVGENNEVCLMHLGGIKKMSKSLSLEELREVESNFHPPQFFRKINKRSNLSIMLSSCS